MESISTSHFSPCILTNSVLVLMYNSHRTVCARTEQWNSVTNLGDAISFLIQSIVFLSILLSIFCTTLIREQYTGSGTEEWNTSAKSLEVLSTLVRWFNRFVCIYVNRITSRIRICQHLSKNACIKNCLAPLMLKNMNLLGVLLSHMRILNS